MRKTVHLNPFGERRDRFPADRAAGDKAGRGADGKAQTVGRIQAIRFGCQKGGQTGIARTRRADTFDRFTDGLVTAF